jgi:hypothetical protein
VVVVEEEVEVVLVDVDVLVVDVVELTSGVGSVVVVVSA